jgi:nucleoid-associated protein YgaU
MPDILTDKQFKNYTKISRYSGVPFYFNYVDNKYQYGMGTNLKDDTSYKTHKVVEGDTLDSLALYYYNNPTYFWIIADFNRIQDPYMDLKIGSYLKIPTFSTIEFLD